MTCIVGISYGENLIFGCDSAASSSHDIKTVTASKIFLIDDFLFGVAGSFRVMDIIRYQFILPKIVKKNFNLDAYMRNEFVDELSNIIDNTEGVEILVGHNKRLFVIQSDWSVLEPSANYTAIGSGAMVALGSLHSLFKSSKKQDAKNYVSDALIASETYTSSVRGPFHYLVI